MESAHIVTFANHFPVYFRAPVIIALVWILWGVNIWVFRQFHINYVEILNFDSNSLLSPKQIILSGMFIIFSVIVIIFGFLNQFPFKDVLLFPSLLYMAMIFCLVMPMNYLHRTGREKLLSNLARVIFPAMTGVVFVEVLLGDVLTSISKVIADIEVTGCVLAAHMVSPQTDQPEHDPNDLHRTYSFHEAECADSYMRPLVTSIPFLLRFRQCWIQFRVTGKAFPNLVNCLKYLSSLPVIWISALTQQEGHMSRELKAAWIFAVSINSFFSFMWDIVMDWGLCRQGSRYFLLREQLIFDSPQEKLKSHESSTLSGEGNNGDDDEVENEFDALVREANEGHRSKLHLHPSSSSTASSLAYLPSKPHFVYYIAIALNFVLRILWSFKLSLHFQLSQEGLTFVLELCEIFRRFVWILFRVEWEAVEKGLVISPPIVGIQMTDMEEGPIKRNKTPRTRLDWQPAAPSTTTTATTL